MAGFFKRLRRKSSVDRSSKERQVSIKQRQDVVQLSQQDKKRPMVQEISAKHLENEVDSNLKEFQSYIKQIKETSLGLEELGKLVKAGEIPENAYRLILEELGGRLFVSVDDAFKLREALEVAKAKAKLEWAKEKVSVPERAIKTTQSKELQYVRGYTDVIESDYWGEAGAGQKIYSLDLQRWEEIMSKIDFALSSLPIEDEAAIIEQFLSLIKERLTSKARTEDIENAIIMCQQRLNSISDRWTSIRRVHIEKVMNLDLEASKVKDELKEFEARYSVGEIAPDTFEYNVNVLQGILKKTEKDISNIRNLIDKMDMKIFRCAELLRENQ